MPRRAATPGEPLHAITEQSRIEASKALIMSITGLKIPRGGTVSRAALELLRLKNSDAFA
jgi:hypothetical protein